MTDIAPAPGSSHSNQQGDPKPSTRVPPHNLEAERSLLGAMLLTRDAVGDAQQIVKPEHFYRPAHGHVFDAITSLYSAGEPADTVTVADELKRAGLLDTIGGTAELVDLQASTPAATNANKYAEIVFEHAMLRNLIGVASEIAEIGFSEPEDVIKAVDTAEAMMYDVAQGRVVDSMETVRELFKQNLDRLEELYERDGGITGTPTGYRDLDELLSGMQPNALLVVGARPAMGKTAFGLGAATAAAVQGKKPVLFFSLEMSRPEISARILQAEARVDATRMRDGKLDASDWKKVSEAVGRLSEAPIWIDDNPNLTILDIRAKARRLKSQVGDLGLVVVDYIQLMTGRSSAENRQVEVSEISRGLKILARELECPVMALSQLSRGLESRVDKRPMLADLRESGAIEQDADVVMFLYRDEVYNPDSEDQGTAEVIVAKHRNGPTGLCRLAFFGKYTQFKDMAKTQGQSPPASRPAPPDTGF